MIQWNKVTWYSKLLSVIFFIGVLPVWTFCIGQKYQETQDIYRNIKKLETPSVTVPQEEFYCSDTSPGGFVQCQFDKFKKADSEMKEVYNKIISFLDKGIAEKNLNYPSVKESFVKSQKSWQAYVESSCEVESGMIIDSGGHSYIGGNDSKVIYPACKEIYTINRTKTLQQIYQYWDPEIII